MFWIRTAVTLAAGLAALVGSSSASVPLTLENLAP
jgi:hypothetical protein